MGSGRRMRWLQLWLIACLAFFSLFSPAAGSPTYVMSAPNLLRIGTEERIFIEIQDNVNRNQNVNVQIRVMNHPTKATTFTSTSVTLTDQANFQAFAKIVIPPEIFANDRNGKHYVTLQAQFPDQLLEKVALVSFQSGFIFIQTDKPIYTPSSSVRYRIFAMWPDMQSQSDTSVNFEIVTPAGIVIESKIISLRNLASGIYTDEYRLGNIVSFGNWKMVANFHSNAAESFTTEFEVKEYVLPSFEVKLLLPPTTPFFYVDSNALNITIKATYTFGREVDGTAYVVFGFINGNEKKSFPSSLQRVPIQNGNGMVTLLKKHITEIYKNILDLVGKSIYVSVSVLTESGSEMVEAELKGIKIVQSPYTIHFKRTPKHFKPGLSFDVTVEVLNPDGSPAEGIPVSVNPGGVLATTKSNGIARLPINPGGEIQSLQITARTNYPPNAPNRQATATMVALPYKSPSNSLLHLSVHTAEVELGDSMKLDLYFTKPESQEKHITYLILSRGQLVKHFREKNVNLNQMSVTVDITKEMLPSFRIVAFYHTSSNELVSDSVWVDVTDTCMGKLTLEMKTPAASYEPRKTINVLVTGDPGATVGMVAVDDAVYILNNKNRLTQKKIWDVVEQYDTGCTAGGGKDGRNVFYDAGLLFQSSHDGSPSRTDLKCPTATRRKRETTILEVRTSLISGFRTHLQKDCCLDGMKEIPVSYTCERRTEYIMDGPECKQAFLHCCNEMKKQRDERKVEILHLARSETDDYKVSNDEIVSRSNFPESWFWKDISLRCPANDPNCNTVTAQKTEALPDTITTWQLTAVSMSKTHGLCVAKPLKIITWKPFFIDLRLPYSAVQGEQLEIRAILHNYDDNPITVRIELKEEASICSAAYKKKWFRTEVQVGRQTTRAVPFIIIPMKHGSFPIEVKAAVKGSFHSDGVRKKLLVVPQGVLMQEQTKRILDPARKGGRQEEMINSDIPMAHLVPNTPESTLISLTGIGQMNTLLDNVISGESMGSLIRAPSGCGEQNMKGVTLPVIAALYLDKTNQWEDVGFEKRNEAIQHIKTGYETQFKFRKDDGSFAMYSYRPSTTWLTAYVAKVFAMATAHVHIDTSVVCGAIKFLILQTQRPDGMFVEVGEVSDKSIIGDVGGVDSDASMTAFCLIAMKESSRMCSDYVPSLSNSMRKAQAYLEQRLQRLTNPYAVALTSYALVNFKKLDRGVLFRHAAPDRTHWPVQKGKDATLEATAYALLALVKDQAFEEAKPIVRWLSQQQRYGGGYGATQATIMVYQAVAEYASNVNEPPFDLNVDVSIKGRSLMNKINLNNQNHYSTRTSKFEGINKDVTVTATGTGEAMFNMVSLYYAIPTKRESDCEMFDLTVELIEVSSEENKRVYKLKILVLYKNTERNASMSILDIGLPTGYKFNKNDLDALSTGRDRIIDEYEANKELSEKGSLIIYLNKVSHTRPEEISFRIEQSMSVEFLQPAAVSVYEYYDIASEKRCVKFYRPQRKSGELLRLCQSEACLCAEENCSKQRKEKISNDNRLEKACESTESSKIDFVYKVVVVDFFDNYTTDSYNVRILQTFKNGTTDESPLDQYRTFLTYQHCREALDLRPGKTYLIMGTSADIHIVGTSFRYIIGETTWVEYWPTPEECQTDIHRPVCMDLELMEDQLVDFGCIMKK
ncbi:complement C3-like [Poecilia latipinna]|uniref:complement C3-like n=1 Tax=Poecilia latipinna TaxID=48699 RepID=UPI00072E3B37|nr:PREDICTED: complement C3-like [Poecilia latipinna]